MTDTQPEQPGPGERSSAKQHGDPLLASAQGRNDGDDGSRHGHDAAATDEPPAGG